MPNGNSRSPRHSCTRTWKSSLLRSNSTLSAPKSLRPLLLPSQTARRRHSKTAAKPLRSSSDLFLQPSPHHSLRQLALSTAPNPSILWAELKSQYSASVGAHQANLLQQMWTVPIVEGTDPNKRLAEIRSAHAQINSSGTENLSDGMLAYAMTLALPESYDTLKQTLWLRDNLKSADVQAAVNAEWTRRGAAGEASANKVTGQRQGKATSGATRMEH